MEHIPTPPEIETKSAGQQIARAAGIVMIAYILSTLIGIVRGMVVSRVFGTSAALDSFNAANRVTELLFNLTAGGALGSAFIPMFTGYLTRKDQKGAWRLASGVVNSVLIVLVLVSVLMWIFAPFLVERGLFALVSDSNVVQVAVTVRLLRIMLPTVIIFGLSGLVMGMLNAHQIFLWPAVAPAAYSLGIILGVLLLPTSWGINRLAIGTVIGALGHMLVQLPAFFRLPNRGYELAAGFKDTPVRKVLRLMLPRIFGAGIVQLNFMANTIISLSLGAGSASALTWAFTLMLMPQAAIAQSAGTASLPTLSAQVELGKYGEFKKTLTGIVRVMLLLAIPATVGLVLLRVPLVRVLYERGSFDATSTQMVAWALLWYAVGLIGHSLVEVLSRAFYAMHDTKTPVLVGVAAMTGNILLSFTFSNLFSRVGWLPLGGLALANTAATAIESLVLLVLMRRRLGGLNGKQLLKTAGLASAASVVMGVVLYAWMIFFGNWNKFLLLAVGALSGALVYVVMIWVLKVPEIRMITLRLKCKMAEKG